MRIDPQTQSSIRQLLSTKFFFSMICLSLSLVSPHDRVQENSFMLPIAPKVIHV